MRALLDRIFAGDLRSWAVFRIGLGLWILLDLALRLEDFSFFFTDQGPLPIQAVLGDSQSGGIDFSLYFLSSYSGWPYFLWAATACAAFALMVGWRVRAICPMLWVLHLSLQSRASLSLNASDRLILTFLFFGCFLPWDRLWAVGKPRRLPPENCRVFHPAGAALILQMVLVYLMACLSKLDPVWIGDGSALYLALLSEQFSRAVWLSRYTELCRWATYSVVVWEAVGPFLLLSPLGRVRLVAIGLFALFHIGTALLFDIGLFPWVCLLGLAAWLPSVFWDGSRVSAEVRREPTTTGQRWLVGGGLALLVVANLGPLLSRSYNVSSLRSLVRVSGFEQKWSLFAPTPRINDVWYVAVPEYKDKSIPKRDLLHPGQSSDDLFRKPPSLIQGQGSHRVRQYLIALEHDHHTELRTWLVYYLFRTENGRVGPGKLERVTIYQMLEPTRPGFRDAPPTRTPFAVWPPAAQAP